MFSLKYRRVESKTHSSPCRRKRQKRRPDRGFACAGVLSLVAEPRSSGPPRSPKAGRRGAERAPSRVARHAGYAAGLAGGTRENRSRGRLDPHRSGKAHDGAGRSGAGDRRSRTQDRRGGSPPRYADRKRRCNQTFAGQPPPALLVAPEDLLAAIRTSMMLGAVLPEMRAETEALASDLSDLLQLRRSVSAERDSLAGEVGKLGLDRQR